MNSELTNKLYTEFPELFRDKDKPMTEICMCWGFEFSDGWFDITYKLCKDIMKYCNDNNVRVPTITQAKEKFGSGRIYIDAGDEHIYNLIWEWEDQTGNICEICGKSGKTSGSGWLKTLCEKHRKKWVVSKLLSD